MFGPTLTVITKYGLKINLQPLKKIYMADMAEKMSDPLVRMWTMNVVGLSEESELEWFEKARTREDSYHWVIIPDGEDMPIGVTGLHGVDSINLACSSGIIIYDKKWWQKGIASATHLARTWYAANILNRNIIKTTVFDANDGSRRALLSVGYAVTGIEPCEMYRNGRYYDLIQLRWFNPHRTQILFPHGIPEQYRAAIEKAEQKLNEAEAMLKLT